ncbi:MAG: hypothetical protein WBG92_12655 [Thiohalocapsa sp.]
MSEPKVYTYLFLVRPDSKIDTMVYANDLPALQGDALGVALRINPNLGENTRRAIANLEMRRVYVNSPSVYVYESEVEITPDELQEIINQHVAAGTLGAFLSDARLHT